MDEWEFSQTALSTSVIKYELFLAGRPLSFDEFLSQLKINKNFQVWFSKLLAESSFEAFRWECPPLKVESLSNGAQFVLVHEPSFATRPTNGSAFRKFFNDNHANAFSNLGGDAVMIVPSPKTDPKIYGHLASFIRHAPTEQKQALWGLVAEEALKNLSEKPTWLSTAGGGVPWLHVRLDKRPKYYHHQPYRTVIKLEGNIIK